jgi:hypothetical protein
MEACSGSHHIGRRLLVAGATIGLSENNCVHSAHLHRRAGIHFRLGIPVCGHMIEDRPLSLLVDLKFLAIEPVWHMHALFRSLRVPH